MGLLKSKIFGNNFIIKIIESFFGKGSFLLFTLIFSIVCTRLYGAEIFGKFTYAFTLVQILMIVARAGLDSGLIYSIPKNKYLHVSFSFVVNFIISLVIILVTWLILDDMYVKWMLILVWFMSMEQLFFGIYRAQGEIKEYYFINGFISMLIRVGAVIALYYLSGKNEYSILVAVYISFLFSNIMYFYQNREKFKKVIFDKSHLLYSFPLIIATMMGTLINRVDIIMLGNMATNTDVGIYQVTVQISSVVSVLLIVFNTVFAPEIAKLFHQDKHEALKRLYTKATRLLAVFSLVTTTVLVAGSEFFLYIFGAEFVEGQTALIFNSIGQFVNIAVGGVWLMLSMTGKPKFQMYANLIAFGINIILNLMLIPVYGIVGAAVASMVTVIFTNITGYIIVARRFKVKVFKFI